MKTKRIIVLLALIPLLVLCVTCGNLVLPGNDVTEERPLTINNNGKAKVLAVTNMSSQNAALEFFLSRTPLSPAESVSSRSALSQHIAGPSPSRAGIRMDLDHVSEFNANPPPFSRDKPAGKLRSLVPVFYPVGQTKYFWLETGNTYDQRLFKLQAQGDYCSIWISTDNFYSGNSTADTDNRVTKSQAENLSSKFDAIYPLATKLLGYEYGGDFGDPYGGIDENSRIQILVYDIDNDFYETIDSGSGVAGFFYSKDEYTQQELNALGYGSLKSNEAEMFYIDAYFTDAYPDTIYSTLIHEFQHMINFNQKAIKLDKSSETWYDEMLAMLAEDVIAPKIGIGPTEKGHPITERIPGFLSRYMNTGVDQWDDSLDSYSNTYAFGAYLIRNYGGPELIESMMSNNLVNRESVTKALQTVNYTYDLSFDSALENYAEAFLYSDTTGINGRKTFDESPDSIIKGETYTADDFNVWTITRDPVNAGKRGPLLYSLSMNRSHYRPMVGHSVLLFEIPSGVSGTLYLNLTRPEGVDIKTVVLEYDEP